MSICSIEDVAAGTDGQPFWFQLYVMRDRDFIERLIDRAKAAELLGAGAHAGPADHRPAPQGPEERPVRAAQADAAQHAQHGDQAALGPGHAGHQAPPASATSSGHVKGVDDMGSLSEWTRKQFDPTLNWDDVEWIKKRWGGKLILKGIQDVEDARAGGATRGADALIVSNHGGRQLDGAESSIRALPAIVDAVGKRHRGAHGRRHPLRPGRAQGAWRWAPRACTSAAPSSTAWAPWARPA